MPLTPDAIPTNEQIRESLADRFYHPHKKAILTAGAALIGLIIGFLALREFRSARLDDMWRRYNEAAEQFNASALSEVDRAAAQKQIDLLAALVRDYPDEAVTPFALEQKIRAQVALEDFDGALQTLEDLRARFKDFGLNVLPADPDAAGRPRSLAQRLEEIIRREKQWASRRTYQHRWPSEDRLALVETTAGSFWLGFYSHPDEAPAHVEAFVRRAKQGEFNGTQIYKVVASPDGTPNYFEAGSRASGLDRGGEEAVRDPAEHARDEPTDTIDPENAISSIRHLHRVVSAAKMDSGESAMRFLVVARPTGMESLNGETTPFAAVMDREKSLETIAAIGRATTYATHPDTAKSEGAFRMRDHPYPAIYIRRVTIFFKEKPEDGHAWDLSRVGRNEPEPWEARRVSPKPEQFVAPK